jgi:LysM repeat protein
MEYLVKPGDTLYTIAQQFNTTIQQLVELNEIENADYLEAGQVIQVPNEEVPEGEIPEEEVPPDEERPITRDFDYRIANGLLITFFTTKTGFQLGESVRLNLVKVNISQSPITLNYPTGQRVDFIARTEGREVWQWSKGRSFAQITQEVTLQPGEALVFRETWNQQNNNQQQISPGIYQIEGWNVARELRREILDIFIEIR